MMSSPSKTPKLPLYLRSNVSKNIECGSLVVNPNIDFKIYKVLVISDKHMLVIDERLVLHKFKIKNFLSVNYVFNINLDLLNSEKIAHTSVSVSDTMFEICKDLIKKNDFYEIFNNDQSQYVDNNRTLKINSKIIITKSKNSSEEYHNESDKSVSWLDHYASVKLKDSNERIYLSFVRNAKICRV